MLCGLEAFGDVRREFARSPLACRPLDSSGQFSGLTAQRGLVDARALAVLQHDVAPVVAMAKLSAAVIQVLKPGGRQQVVKAGIEDVLDARRPGSPPCRARR